MEFKEFNGLLQKHVADMCAGETHLFEVELDKDALWNKYLDSFPPGTNEIFRERREFDCSCCRHFMRDFGNIVAIKDGHVKSIWDFETHDDKYQPVIDALSRFVHRHVITDVYMPQNWDIGTKQSTEIIDGNAYTWSHLSVTLPKQIVIHPRDNVLVNRKRGELRDTRNVFERSLNELSKESVETVLELIAQNSLYKGEEWKGVLEQFLRIQKEYEKLSDAAKALYCWKKSLEVGPVIGRIRNHSIGTLLIEISEGTDLDEALRKYEKVVAPTNYKRPKAVFTKRMVEDARKTVAELGLEGSLERRHAKLDDITVNNILFANRDAHEKMIGDAFSGLAAAVAPSNDKKFSKLTEIPIDDFIKEVLPTAQKVELLLDSMHMNNMVSLIAPKNAGAKSMFKWSNGFSWAYAGNITDSMKDKVKALGGKVDGVLRFSIQWNDYGKNLNDLDAHCQEPDTHIYFGNKVSRQTGGNLDVDIIHPSGVAVENITWPQLSKMKNGTYYFFVENFTDRGGQGGFSAEIEFEGKVYSFVYNNRMRNKERVNIAAVTLKDGQFFIKEALPAGMSSVDVWGLKTNEFYPVSVAMYSPNYWDEQDGIGHRHYFFMLEGCKNPDTPNGFFNEFLREDLMKHKRVFEALGASMKVENSDTQLSGVGFSVTKRNSFVCKVEGNFKRMLKVII